MRRGNAKKNNIRKAKRMVIKNAHTYRKTQIPRPIGNPNHEFFFSQDTTSINLTPAVFSNGIAVQSLGIGAFFNSEKFDYLTSTYNYWRPNWVKLEMRIASFDYLAENTVTTYTVPGYTVPAGGATYNVPGYNATNSNVIPVTTTSGKALDFFAALSYSSNESTFLQQYQTTLSNLRQAINNNRRWRRLLPGYKSATFQWHNPSGQNGNYQTTNGITTASTFFTCFNASLPLVDQPTSIVFCWADVGKYPTPTTIYVELLASIQGEAYQRQVFS
jgi:hypothetical protein